QIPRNYLKFIQFLSVSFFFFSCIPFTAICVDRCKYGECVLPDTCKCYPGYTGKTCNQDIDECATGRAVCSFNRRCINTFGSFYCKCQIGYKLKHLNGRYDCIVAHENSVKAIHRMPGIIKEKWKKLLLPKKNAKKHDDIKNTIPASKAHVSPLDYEDDLYLEGAFSKWGESTEDIRKDRKTIEQESIEEEGEIEHLKNQTVHEKKLRGDVFCCMHPLPPIHLHCQFVEPEMLGTIAVEHFLYPEIIAIIAIRARQQQAELAQQEWLQMQQAAQQAQLAAASASAINQAGSSQDEDDEDDI
ncbi:PREDICTED: epidermal growth factor-like protein 6, partial [Thamnophis sirtalis]|uniref:Epidermal growth factor-like protein 6 n=1 Tax=Thamnophis sirtalis TaxID=35019 RepID=A0A6I9Y6T1_9SAUR